MRPRAATRRLVLMWAVGSVLAVAALTQATLLQLRDRPARPSRLLLAPMIGVIEPCILLQEPGPDQSAGAFAAAAPADPAPVDAALASRCTGAEGSAAALVETTLSTLAPAGNGLQRYELGYTLPVPLLKLFKAAGSDWAIDKQMVERLVRTVRDNDRPAIVYLFSTHFEVNAPIEAALAANPANLSVTAAGPLGRDSYYASAIYNWTFASTRTAITARRVEAATAVIDEICRLEPRHLQKIRGVSLLGELHHLFPNFEGGMGFSAPYRVSDYSEASRLGFRMFLQQKFGTIDRLNQALGSTWASFEQLQPPAKDIRTEPLRDFTEHIDSFAHGTLPIAGWAHVNGQSANAPVASVAPMLVRIYRNGELIGKTPVSLSRQDVLQARPEFGDANPGWRFDLDFRNLPFGVHRIDALLERDAGTLVHLATRHVAIMDRRQLTPEPMPQKPLPASVPADGSVQAYVDLPADRSSYFYNPLVPMWHAFRGHQVVDYLEYFGRVLDASCLSTTPRYSHQIIPFTNPGWDANKFAIDASLTQLKNIRLGVSLYGEASYGDTFAKWIDGTAHRAYGVTEFHPSKPLAAAELQGVLDRHAGRGAQFVSFFLEPRWNGELVPRAHNIFSFDPDNPKFGSDRLYQSVRQLLALQP